MVQIEIHSGPDAGQTVSLGPGTHLIGRHPSADLRLPVESVSGRHLELRVDDAGAVHFRDLGSTNGTFSAGAKVTEGEWFPGTELTLGKASLKLVDPAAPAGAASGAAPGGASGGDDDAELHARARAAAMEGGRRGGPMMLLLLVVLVVGAGGAYWFLGRGPAADDDGDGSTPAGAGGPTVVQRDAIDDLGSFSEEAAPSWTLQEGMEITAGALRATSAGQRAQLVRQFDPGAGGLRLRAEVGARPVWPLVAWGRDEAEDAIWMGPALTPAGVDVALPADASWFQLTLIFGGASEVRGLTVEQAPDAVAVAAQHENRDLVHGGGDLLLHHTDGRAVLLGRAPGGSWETIEGGLRYTAAGDPLTLRAGPALAGAPLLILGEGGPLPAAEGTVVEDSPGLLFDSGAIRLLGRFSAPTRVVSSDGRIACQFEAGADGQPVTLELRWELTEEMTQGSRLARQLQSAARDGDRARVLEVSGQILRDYPFDEEDVLEAGRMAREVLQEARDALTRIAREKADATFLQSIEDLERLETEARALAKELAGTELAEQARAEAEDLARTAGILRESRRAETAAYRARLTTALSSTYPVLSAWLQEDSR